MKVFSPFLNGDTTTSGSLNLPQHPTASAIINPNTGSIYHDTTDNVVKVYTGTQWQVLGEQTTPAPAVASADIEYLVVAGGGGGAIQHGGGGGAGGYLSSSLASVTSGSSFTVTVGSGGAGGAYSGGNTSGINGVDSSIAGASISTITATGGGGGSSYATQTVPGDGGSGGGGGNQTSGAQTGGSGTAGQGNDGGDGATSSTNYPSGGGGGAGAVGGNGSAGVGGNGGIGKQSPITGTATYYAGGGGSGTYNGGTPGTGGLGGGATGVSALNTNGNTGTANTGGGGSGGNGGEGYSGGAGGSGVAIFAYNSGSLSGLGGIKSSRSDGHVVHTFNSSGTLTIGGPNDNPIIPQNNFQTVLYTGQSVPYSVNVGFKPDLIWAKSRDNAYLHGWFDTLRPNGRFLQSNSTDAQSAANNTALHTLTNTGFTWTESSGGFNSTGNYVAWCWKAGGTAVANTNGTITSQVSANQAAGFSIVSWTSTGSNTSSKTVGHGLENTPDVIILKNLSAAGTSWRVYHSGIPSPNNTLALNSTETAFSFFPSVSSNTFGLANSTTTGEASGTSGQNIIAYCFHSVNGYQKMGSYTGNGSTNGPTITTGFRPKFILVKPTSVADNWTIWDNIRDTGDNIDQILVPSNNSAESANGFGRYDITLSSTGFQIKRTDGQINTLNASYIYWAIA